MFCKSHSTNLEDILFIHEWKLPSFIASYLTIFQYL